MPADKLVTGKLESANIADVVSRIFGNKKDREQAKELVAAETYSPLQTPGDIENKNYFKGLSGMDANSREKWVKQYKNELDGLDSEQQDSFYRTKMFDKVFATSKNPEDLKLWANSMNMTRGERDIAFARKALIENLDGQSNSKEELEDDPDASFNESMNKSMSKSGVYTLRDEAEDFLTRKSERLGSKYIDLLNQSQNIEVKAKRLELMDKLSNDVSPYYKQYNGTNKLSLSEDKKTEIAGLYNGWLDVGGPEFALRKLTKFYQNTVAENQSYLEKVKNTGLNLVNTGAGSIIRMAAMTAALAKETAEGVLNVGDNEFDPAKIIENDITKLADGISLTGSWSRKEQERLKELGLTANPILNTVEQQQQLLSMNTPFELLSQYGFTIASTAMMGIGSAAVKGGVNLLSSAAKLSNWSTKAANAAKIAKYATRLNDIGNGVVLGAVAMTEGGMNAADTKERTLNTLNEKINKQWDEQIDKDIEGFVRGTNTNMPEENVAEAVQLMKSKPGIIDYYKNKHKVEIDKDLAQAEKTANSAMYTDFVMNSAINGAINSTLQKTMSSPGIQKMLNRRFGKKLTGGIDDVVDIEQTGSKFTAIAKKYTKGQAIKKRASETFGEGLEEYFPELSSAFSEGAANSSMEQYIENKYKSGKTTDALEEDVITTGLSGLMSVGEAAVSKQAIKAGLYGAMSVFMGGPNLNHRLITGQKMFGARQEGETKFAALTRNSPIEWRSGISPLFTNEVPEENKRREEVAKDINTFFSAPEVQESFFNVASNLNWMDRVATAQENGDERAARDAKFGEMISSINTLNSLKNTGYYEAAMASLKARQEFKPENLDNPESVESKAVAEFKTIGLNKTLDISDAEILEDITKNSKKMLELIDKTGKEQKEVEKIFGKDLDKDVKNAIVFARAQRQDAEERIGKLTTEINDAKTDILASSSTDSNSDLLDDEKIFVARNGQEHDSEETIKQTQQEIEKSKQDLQKIDLALKDKSLKKDQVNALLVARQQITRSIKVAEQDSENSKKVIAGFEKLKDKNVVLSVADILKLDDISMAVMLHPENLNNYSIDQQANIKEVLVKGINKFQDFQTKVIDRGSLTQSKNISLQKEAFIINNPKGLNNFVGEVKKNKRVELTNKKYNYLKDYKPEEYAEFSNAFTSAVVNSQDDFERTIIYNIARTNPLFKKMEDKSNEIDNIQTNLKNSSNYAKLEQKDKILFSTTLEYLSENDIDLADPIATTQFLSKSDETGKLLFDNYIQERNKNVASENQISIQNIGEAIQTFNDFYKENVEIKADKEAAVKPIEVTPVINPVDAKVEATKVSAASEKVNTKVNIPEEESKEEVDEVIEDEEDPVVEKFKETNTDEVVDFVRGLVGDVKVTREDKANEEVKKLTIQALDELSKNEFDSINEFHAAVIGKSNSMSIAAKSGSKNDNLERAATILKSLTQEKVAKKDLGNKTSNNKIDPNNKLEGRPDKIGQVASQGVDVLSKLSPVWKNFIEKNKIREFLEEGKLDKDSDVFFISDTQLDKDIAKEIVDYNAKFPGKTPTNYNEDNRVLLAAVKVPVEGGKEGETRYQVIGVMSRSQNQKILGAFNLAGIRSRMNVNALNEAITDETGKPIIAKLNDVAMEVTVDPGTSTSQRSLQVNPHIQLSSSEQEQLPTVTKKPLSEKVKDPLYNKIKEATIKVLKVVKTFNDKKQIIRQFRNAEGKIVNTLVETRSVLNTRHPETGKFIIDLFKNNRISEAVSANSKLRRYGRNLNEILLGLDNKKEGSENIFQTEDFVVSTNVDTGNEEFDIETQKIINTVEEKLQKELQKSLFVSRGNLKYKLSPVQNVDENGVTSFKRDEKNRIIFNLSLDSDIIGSTESIKLGEVTNKGLSDEEIFNIEKNLFLETKTVDDIEVLLPRMSPISNKRTMVTWQIDYGDIEHSQHNAMARRNTEEMYDEDLFEITQSSTIFGAANGVILDLPTKVEVPEVTTDPTVATLTNGATVDVKTNKPLTGTIETPVNKPAVDPKKVVEQLEKDSEALSVTEDEKFYTNSNGGFKSLRASSIASSDKSSGTKMSSFDPAGVPSSNIGTGVDEFVRDVLDGLLDDDDIELSSIYPNASEKQLQEFKKQVIGFKLRLTAAGMTIIPRSTTVNGTVNVTDSSGNIHPVNVTGTMDIIAYDAEGNFYIYDMKSRRTDNLDDSKLASYTRQLSLYKKLLEQKYGVTVKEIGVLPIVVKYPTPIGETGGIAKYSVKDASSKRIVEKNQLVMSDKTGKNSKEFKDSNPVLGSLIVVNEVALDIDFNKLSTEEKQFVLAAMDNNVTSVEGNTANVEKITTPSTTVTPSQNGTQGKYVPANLRWGVWEGATTAEGKPIDAEKFKEALLDAMYTEERWNAMADDLKEQEIKCKGV